MRRRRDIGTCLSVGLGAGQGAAQDNGNAIANGVQGLLRVSGAGCLKGRG